jgi:hypothetical protein
VLQKGMGRVGVVLLGMEGLRGGDEGRRSCDGERWGGKGEEDFQGTVSAGPFLGTCEAGDENIV